MSGSWGVVVPVKRLELAKTRLSPYGEDERRRLALAFAADVVVAALRTARVLVVTDDATAAGALSALGARVVPDDPDAGLNPALEHGAQLLRDEDATTGTACLSADLPALREDDLRSALSRVGAGRGYVPDLDGRGTTLLAAGPGQQLQARFGGESAASHEASGARRLSAGAGLRCDVDTAEDLLLALAIGCGPRTTEAARSVGMQAHPATVSSWSTDGGTARLDDGTPVRLPPDALQRSGLRFVRAGQRVRLARDAAGGTRLALP